MTIFPVIMAGGPGSRLWPESRRAFPKPFLSLLNDSRSLFRATLDRLVGFAPNDSIFVAAGKSFARHVFEQAPEIPKERVLLEPIGRDTAACVAWAALEALRLDEDATLLVLPSDAYIEPDEPFCATIRRGVDVHEANPDALVTFGVEPTFASTSHGYIERGEPTSDARAYRAVHFHEKPEKKVVEDYVASGRFFWNMGIFVWKARLYLDLLQRYEPQFVPTLRTMSDRIEATRGVGKRPDDDPEFVDAFSHAKKISVDYAVLQRAKKIFVVPATGFQWKDLGSFSALEELNRRVSTGENVVFNAASIEENSRGNYVRATSVDKLVALIDVEDLLVVETDDVLLISKKGNDQALKDVVERLKNEGLDRFL
ncbi:MAG: mannose-1-phosphate guanylyltransferase [Thermoguttaceae bacterium]|nr:mannose-1-phosphate guanylyltransferase [Thermoguttaceae bacterium]